VIDGVSLSAVEATHESEFLSGVIEGFYGKPWTPAERIELFGSMARWGLNTHFYAPKDHLHHRALWREPYGAADAGRRRRARAPGPGVPAAEHPLRLRAQSGTRHPLSRRDRARSSSRAFRTDARHRMRALLSPLRRHSRPHGSAGHRPMGIAGLGAMSRGSSAGRTRDGRRNYAAWWRGCSAIPTTNSR
jgi:hypothetical protein